MADPRQPPPTSFNTPVLSTRAFTSTAASQTVGSSRLPLRRPSISGPPEGLGVTMTAGRLPALRRPSISASSSYDDGSAPATASRLPTRRPSLGSLGYVGASGLPLPSTALRTAGTLKRTSTTAGLPQDTETTSLKRQLARAQRDIEDLQHASELKSLESHKSISELQSQVTSYAKQTERLERHRAILLGQEREREERDKAKKDEGEKEMEGLKAELRSTRKELGGLKDRYEELNASFLDLEHEAEQAAAEVRAGEETVEGLERELEQMRADVEHITEGYEDERKKGEALKAVEEKMKMEQSRGVDAEVIREELHRQVAHLKTLEKENAKLTRKLDTYEKQHANIEVLKESNKALEKRLSAMDDLRKQFAIAQAEADDLKREKREWLSFLDPTEASEFSSPRKLTKTLAATRIENASFQERLDARDLEMHRRERLIGSLETRVSELVGQLDVANKGLAKAEGRAKQEESRLLLLHQEVAMLKRHLKTYSAEEATNQAGNFDEQKTARILELEALLDAHKIEISDLSKGVAHWRGLVERYGGSTTEIVELEAREDESEVISMGLAEQLRVTEAIQAQLDALKNEYALAEKEIEALELENDRLTYEHGNGSYDTRTTKVLELRMNPDTNEHAIRSSTLERLREENETLLERVEELEQRKGAAVVGVKMESMVPRQSLINVQAELEAALAVVKQKETMELRLTQVFSAKADEFRKVVRKLLGYRLDILSGGRVKVSSMYAPSKDHSFLFNVTSSGSMELVGAGSEKGALSDEVKRQIKFWIGERKSVPGFLSSISLTWFEDTTKGGSLGFVSG